MKPIVLMYEMCAFFHSLRGQVTGCELSYSQIKEIIDIGKAEVIRASFEFLETITRTKYIAFSVGTPFEPWLPYAHFAHFRINPSSSEGH